MIKKTIIYLLLLITVSVLFSGPAEAVETAELTLSEGSIGPEGKIEVILSIDKNPGLIYLAVSMNYGAGLTLVSAEDAGLMSVAPSVAQSTGNVPCYIIWNAASASENIVNTGTLITFKFMINDNATTDNTKVAVSLDEAYDYDLDPVSASKIEIVTGARDPDTDTEADTAAADKAKLEDMLTEGKELDKNNFTSESWKTYEEFLKEAESAAGDPDSPQADIDRITGGLNRARDLLVNNETAETEAETGTSENTPTETDVEEYVSYMRDNYYIIWITAAAAVIVLCALTVFLLKKNGK